MATVAGSTGRQGLDASGIDGHDADERSERQGDAPQVSAAAGRRRFVLMIAALLYLFGLVMVTSATSGTEMLNDRSPWEWAQKQLIFGVLGVIALSIAMRVPMALLRRLALPMMAGSLALMPLVFLPGIGLTAGGAARWIQLPMGFQLQPSELVKFAVIIFVADHLARTPPPRHWMRDFVQSRGGVALAAAVVIFLQSDLGTAMVTGAVVITLYLLCGTSWRVLGRVIGPGIALVAIGILSEDYRRDRFTAFLNPWADPSGEGYQLVQALLAIGSGGPFGVGLGHSVEKIHYLPEAHTDMIFSIIAEELGLVGVAVVLFSFSALAVVGSIIAVRARTRFEALLAAGLTAAICGQAVLNLGGVVGILPLTGIPLPLVSYGGSSLVVVFTAIGLLANIAVASPETPTDRQRPDAGERSSHPDRSRRHGGAPGPGTGRRRAPA